jgi:hypothetical protein
VSSEGNHRRSEVHEGRTVLAVYDAAGGRRNGVVEHPAERAGEAGSEDEPDDETVPHRIGNGDHQNDCAGEIDHPPRVKTAPTPRVRFCAHRAEVRCARSRAIMGIRGQLPHADASIGRRRTSTPAGRLGRAADNRRAPRIG